MPDFEHHSPETPRSEAEAGHAGFPTRPVLGPLPSPSGEGTAGLVDAGRFVRIQLLLEGIAYSASYGASGKGFTLFYKGHHHRADGLGPDQP